MNWTERVRRCGVWVAARAKEPSTWAGAAGIASVLGWGWAAGPLSAAATLVEAFGKGGAAAAWVALPAVMGAMIAHRRG